MTVSMLKKRRFNYYIFIFVLFILSALNTGYAGQDTLTIKIIETSDVHGALFPFDFTNRARTNHSLGNISSFVNQERNKSNQGVILLDNGDILQGQPLVYYYNIEKNLSVNVCADVMNYMKYDAATIGNHDIETGHPVYDKVRKEFEFPWLAANAIDTKTNKPYFEPYTVINKNGIKTAVLGLITPYIPNWLPESIWKGIVFEDMVQTAKKWVPYILEKEKPDIMVGLFHAGIEAEYNNQNPDSLCNENASQLVAELVPGFDVVFVGHDHVGWNKKVKSVDGKEVMILGTSASAKNAAVATFKFIKDSSSGSVSKIALGELLDMSGYEVDKNYLSRYIGVIQEVNKYVSKTVGEFSDSVSSRDALFGNSAFIDLIHTIQLNYTKADISFTAPLSFDSKIKKGLIYIRDMFNLYKYENFLYTMSLSGQEVKDYLEFSFANWFNQMTGPDDHLLLFKKDEQGNLINTSNTKSFLLKNQYYNFCSAAGIKYTVDVSKPAGKKVNIISMQDGSPFDLNKKYTVALNSYRGNGGGGHLTEGAKIPKNELKNRLISSTPRDLRFYVIRWMETTKSINPQPMKNWKLIPEDWVARGKEKDYKILYGK